MGCRLWGREESDTTEATEQQQQQLILLSAFGSLGVNILFNSSIFSKYGR